MTDLAADDRRHLMDVVLATEHALRELMRPDKVNLASLGNVVPHLHWHVIPRFADDPHFPNPVWGVKQRSAPHAAPADLDAQLAVVVYEHYLVKDPDRLESQKFMACRCSRAQFYRYLHSAHVAIAGMLLERVA